MDGSIQSHTVERVMLVDGKAFVRVSQKSREKISVAMGDRTSEFEPCAREDAERFAKSRKWPLSTFQITTDMSSAPSEERPGQRYAVWVNELEDWALAGCQTLQLMIVDPNVPLTISCGRAIQIRGDVRTADLAFQAYVAVHRAAAKLAVTFTDLADGTQTTRRVALDRQSRGGRHQSGYQEVNLPLPSGSGDLSVTFDIEYQEYREDGTPGEPFVFVADAHVGTQGAADASGLAPIVMDYGEDAALSDTSDTGSWMCAHLPAWAEAGTTVKLHIGRATETIALPERPPIRVNENYMHTMIVDANADALLALYIDGEADHLITVSAGQTAVRVPNRYMDGAMHRVSLRDPSGTVIFWDGYSLVPDILTPADVLQRESAPPFPDTVFAQTPMRYSSMKALLGKAAQTGAKPEELAQVLQAIQTVEGGFERVKLLPLQFPEVEKPDVSIVIPAHNKVEVTYLALASLLLAPNTASFEVIVVDDGSSDETAELETFVSGIKVIHHEESQKFIRACNAGVAEARGTYVALLNNDVEATAGWIDELIEAFERFDNVGLVGSKLIYPNGALQDGGGIVWGSGDPWNYGRGGNPNEPRYTYARQVDYLCGAAMMTTKAIWDEVGGLSSYLEPMYFEDVDFAFKIRDAGYATWYVPSSVIYHYEGLTSGKDTAGSGMKRFQEVNRPKFKRRWASAFAGKGKMGTAPDLEKDRGIVGRVLFVDYMTPRADNDAGSYAIINEMRLAQSLGYKVTFMPTNLAHLGKYTHELQKAGIEAIYAPFYMSVTEFLAQRASEFDAVYITRFYVAREVLDQVRAHGPQARILFNNCDLHFLRELRAAKASGDENRLADARHTRDLELAVIEQADVVLSYNTAEHAVIEAFTEGRAKTVLAPWVVDLPPEVAPLEGREGMSFLGNFVHQPNGEAMQFFVKEVVPLLSGRRRKATPSLYIYGAKMTAEERALEGPTVHPVGFVENVADAYDRHRVFIAPLQSGAGIKGKVLAAMSHGIPCVLSPMAAEGIGLRSGSDCIIASNAADWVEAIDQLMTDDALWHKISDNARAHMTEIYGFKQGRDAMRIAFEAADLFKHGLQS